MNFYFDKKAHIEKMTPHVEKLIEYLNSRGISFTSTDGDLENVIFKNDTKEVKIAHRCFYRFSGMCTIRKDVGDKKKNVTIFFDVSDDMFINQYMKAIIEFSFFGKKEEK